MAEREVMARVLAHKIVSVLATEKDDEKDNVEMRLSMTDPHSLQWILKKIEATTTQQNKQTNK